MEFDLAIRCTEILLGFAFLQQSAEHLMAKRDEHILFAPRALLSILLILGIWTPWACLALLALGLFILKRFQGPYNGGCDRMSLLILFCLTLAHVIPDTQWQELALGYCAIQLVLSYFISGWVKVINPEWRNGQALQNVFAFSAYPASEHLRKWADYPRILLIASWAVILFELLFPLTLFNQTALLIGLCIAASFHLANAYLFGLNRFFWIWLAAYPSIIWLQSKLFEIIAN